MKIESLSQLRDLYNEPSIRAKAKQLSALDPHCQHFVETSPFFILSTYGKNGAVDASPRGGKPGFVKMLDDKTLILPDAKGNNRLDSLTNIVETGQVGLLFLIPGMDETLRINGKAWISTAADHIGLFPNEQNAPKVCLIIEVREAFLHCAKALMRSELWKVEAQIDRSEFPTIGRMLKDQLGGSGPVESQEEMVKRYQKDL